MNNDLFKPGLNKLIHHQEHLARIERGEIVGPIHVSVWPTNKCQLKCQYCCFKKTLRNDTQLSFGDFKTGIDTLVKHGLKATEFSGGGEPLLWENFEQAVLYAKTKNLHLSLVTNGLALHSVSQDILSKFDWIRVSIQSAQYARNIDMSWIPNNVRKSLSYIVNEEEDIEELERIYEFAKKYDIIVRIAPRRPCIIYWTTKVQAKVEGLGYPLLFFDKELGTPNGCYFAWIRGAIDWNGMYLPCPSIELSYGSAGKIPKDFPVCHVSDLESWLINNPPHDMGYKCDFCNCGKEVNNYMHQLLQPLEDINFV